MSEKLENLLVDIDRRLQKLEKVVDEISKSSKESEKYSQHSSIQTEEEIRPIRTPESERFYEMVRARYFQRLRSGHIRDLSRKAAPSGRGINSTVWDWVKW